MGVVIYPAFPLNPIRFMSQRIKKRNTIFSKKHERSGEDIIVDITNLPCRAVVGKQLAYRLTRNSLLAFLCIIYGNTLRIQDFYKSFERNNGPIPRK